MILFNCPFVLFIFIFITLHHYQLECDCNKSSTTATLRLVKQRTTVKNTNKAIKSKSIRRTVKLIKLGPKLMEANRKYQSKFNIRPARIIATSSGSTLVPTVIAQPNAQPVIFAPLLNSAVPLIAQNSVHFKQKSRDKFSSAALNVDAQYENEENGENHKNEYNEQDNQYNKVYTSQPVPMSPVPIISASPIPVLTSAGLGNFPTTITYANANAQAIPNLSQVNSNFAHVPPSINLFIESASGNPPQIGGDEKKGEEGDSNDEENYIVNGVDFTDNNKEHNEEEEEEEYAEGNSEIKLDLDDQSEENNKKKKTTKAYKIQTTFDKINEQLEKLNEQGNNNKKKNQHYLEHQNCHHHDSHHHTHQLSTADYEEEKGMKEEVVHLVLHNNNHYMEENNKMSGFSHSEYNFPAQHQIFPPNHQIYHQSAKQFSNVPTRYVNHDDKNCEDSDEGYYKIKVKSPLAFITKLFDKFIS